MKRGTKVGWVLLALAVLLSIWVLISQNASANVNESGISYEYEDDGTLVITGYSGSSSELTYNDFPEFDKIGLRVKIADYAFANQDVLETVALPSNIVSIGKGAFSSCPNLRTIGLSATNIDRIEDFTFEGCTNLIGVTSLPDGVISIGSRAFGDCKSLDAFVIGPNVEIVADDAFEGCDSLTNLTADLQNKFFAVYAGATFSADGTILQGFTTPYPNIEMTTSDFTANCTTIASGAFDASRAGTNLKILSIPSSVKTIAANAFSNSNIETITIPSSVTSIGSQSNWTALKTIYGYDNSKALDWYEDLREAGIFTDTLFISIGNGGGGGDDPVNPDPPTPIVTDLSVYNFRATADGSAAVNLTWDKNANATSYEISWTGGTTAGGSVTLPSGSTSYRATGLSPNTVYTFTIRARNSTNVGTASTMSATTGTVTPTPDPTPTPNPSPYPYSNQTDQPTYYYPYDPYTTDPGTVTDNNNDVLNGGPSTTAPDAGGKDSTPKTADGDINPMWFLISGILLAGIALLVYTRMRRLQIISKRDKSDLDS